METTVPPKIEVKYPSFPPPTTTPESWGTPTVPEPTSAPESLKDHPLLEKAHPFLNSVVETAKEHLVPGIKEELNLLKQRGEHALNRFVRHAMFSVMSVAVLGEDLYRGYQAYKATQKEGQYDATLQQEIQPLLDKKSEASEILNRNKEYVESHGNKLKPADSLFNEFEKEEFDLRDLEEQMARRELEARKLRDIIEFKKESRFIDRQVQLAYEKANAYRDEARERRNKVENARKIQQVYEQLKQELVPNWRQLQ